MTVDVSVDETAQPSTSSSDPGVMWRNPLTGTSWLFQHYEEEEREICHFIYKSKYRLKVELH